MGYAPPIDAPPPAKQAAEEAAATFGPSPSGADLCGFSLPQIPGFPGLPSLPSFDVLFAFPPSFSFPLPIVCSAGEDLAASVPYGGGRSPSPVPAIDEEFQTGG